MAWIKGQRPSAISFTADDNDPNLIWKTKNLATKRQQTVSALLRGLIKKELAREEKKEASRYASFASLLTLHSPSKGAADQAQDNNEGSDE